MKNGICPPVINPLITSPYGVERIIDGKRHFHDGIDFVSKDQVIIDRLNVLHSEVYAVADGVVCYDYDKYDDEKRYERPNTGGNMVILIHEFEGIKYYFRYLHLITNNVSRNQVVKKGDVIGHYSDAGFSKGPHLHLDVMLFDWSKKIDPGPFLFA